MRADMHNPTRVANEHIMRRRRACQPKLIIVLNFGALQRRCLPSRIIAPLPCILKMPVQHLSLPELFPFMIHIMQARCGLSLVPLRSLEEEELRVQTTLEVTVKRQ